MRENEINNLRFKIERYRKTKNNNMFDDFYHSDLDLILEALSYYESMIPSDNSECEDCFDNIVDLFG